MTATCPFCGAALKQVFPQSSVSVFTCKTVTQEGGGRGLQTIPCLESEVARLTKERDDWKGCAEKLHAAIGSAQMDHDFLSYESTEAALSEFDALQAKEAKP